MQSIYTDGSALSNPGKAGFGVVVAFEDGDFHEFGGASEMATNNAMELSAAIAALQFLVQFKYRQPVTLWTDSEYVRLGITQWLRGWKRRNWKTSAGKPVEHPDLWRQLDALNQQTKVTWKHVKGHSGDALNDRSDVIARGFARENIPPLRTWEPEPIVRADKSVHLDRACPQVAATLLNPL